MERKAIYVASKRKLVVDPLLSWGRWPYSMVFYFLITPITLSDIVFPSIDPSFGKTRYYVMMWWRSHDSVVNILYTRCLVSFINSSLLDISSWICNRHHILNMANFKTLTLNRFHWTVPCISNGISILIVVQNKNLGGIFNFTLFLIPTSHPLVNPVTTYSEPATFSPFPSLWH